MTDDTPPPAATEPERCTIGSHAIAGNAASPRIVSDACEFLAFNEKKEALAPCGAARDARVHDILDGDHEFYIAPAPPPQAAQGEGALLPCPFCPDGGDPQIGADVASGVWWSIVQCRRCFARTGIRPDSASKARERWNTRPSPTIVASAKGGTHGE